MKRKMSPEDLAEFARILLEDLPKPYSAYHRGLINGVLIACRMLDGKIPLPEFLPPADLAKYPVITAAGCAPGCFRPEDLAEDPAVVEMLAILRGRKP